MPMSAATLINSQTRLTTARALALYLHCPVTDLCRRDPCGAEGEQLPHSRLEIETAAPRKKSDRSFPYKDEFMAQLIASELFHATVFAGNYNARADTRSSFPSDFRVSELIRLQWQKGFRALLLLG